MFATRLQRFLYRHALKPLFFRCDPEWVHDRALLVGRALGRFAVTRAAVRFLLAYEHPSLEQTVLGIRFPNPIGLTAGFDKNAELTDILPCVGFGFAEVGSVTGEPCEGNPKPRLWRLPKSRGLLVWFGLKNDGADAIAARLRGRTFAIPVGISVAKTNDACRADTERGIDDYAKAFAALADVGAYVTVNVSCPNAFGGEPFTDPERLERLLARLDGIPTDRPVFVKLPVDLPFDAVDALVAVCDRHRVHGFVASNLTKRRDRPGVDPTEVQGREHGGISGKPTFDASNDLITHLYEVAGRRYVIVASGGVFTAEDAYEKLRRGASLVQLATGMIFEGPQLIGEINRGLVSRMRRDGFASVSEIKRETVASVS